MATISLLVCLAIYLLGGVLAYGQTLADFQLSFPFFAWQHRNRNRMTALLGAFLGPVGFVMAFFFLAERAHRGKFHFRVVSQEDSWQAFQVQFPGLSYDRFLSD